MRRDFFVFCKDSLYGYIFDPHKPNNAKRSKVDSIVKTIAGLNNFELILTLTPDTIIWNNDKTQCKEVYISPKTEDRPSSRLSLSLSSKMNHLKYSFNQKIDSAKQMKLYKTELVFDEFFDKTNKIFWPSSYSVTEMRQATPPNLKEILDYFGRYNKISNDKDLK
jgi:hypothetical protein